MDKNCIYYNNKIEIYWKIKLEDNFNQEKNIFYILSDSFT